MIKRDKLLLAFRARLATLNVADTGSATLAATATGYSRTTGSFLDDNFAPGMEITPAGFGVNPFHVVREVTASALTTLTPPTVSSASAGRSLKALLPEGRQYGNHVFQPVQKRPWIQEQFVPATMTRRTTSSDGGHAEETGLYVVTYFGLADVGDIGILRVGDAIVALFTPGTPFTDGTNAVEISGFPGPWAGPVIPQDDGYARSVVTIPWFASTRITVAA